MSEGYKFWESGASDKLLGLNQSKETSQQGPWLNQPIQGELGYPSAETPKQFIYKVDLYNGAVQFSSDPDGTTTQLDIAIDNLAKVAVDKVRSPSIQNVLRALPSDGGERKQFPITTGVLDYFPLAIAEVARCSKSGNDQHNPGMPLHWARGKSSDHPDCIVRHLIQRGTLDSDGVRHSAKVAWRALALLQEELERESGFIPGEGDNK